ncbi:hypothetical protein [Parasphingorhabdus cellanae]|uniref:DUF4148 domain-containing protein n=1 Tax=Parasphingorhabdus cellanae TaxID=2806553 RepID=A0ABX7T8S1_9SPHN|nr:hypothetical protein [Parasphingorhabdus cellanae]QTD57946.1 hypothetical protein J4G78_05480 [Parasphingorhabdus cellanae]
MTKRHGVYLGLFALAACGPAQNDPGPGGVTVGEAQALDEAAEMLDDRYASPEFSSDEKRMVQPVQEP